MSAPDQKWYVAGKGKAFGPYSVEQLRAFLNAAKIKPDSKVCPAGGKTWTRLAEALPELAPAESPPPPPFDDASVSADGTADTESRSIPRPPTKPGLRSKHGAVARHPPSVTSGGKFGKYITIGAGVLLAGLLAYGLLKGLGGIPTRHATQELIAGVPSPSTGNGAPTAAMSSDPAIDRARAFDTQHPWADFSMEERKFLETPIPALRVPEPLPEAADLPTLRKRVSDFESSVRNSRMAKEVPSLVDDVRSFCEFMTGYMNSGSEILAERALQHVTLNADVEAEAKTIVAAIGEYHRGSGFATYNANARAAVAAWDSIRKSVNAIDWARIGIWEAIRTMGTHVAQLSVNGPGVALTPPGWNPHPRWERYKEPYLALAKAITDKMEVYVDRIPYVRLKLYAVAVDAEQQGNAQKAMEKAAAFVLGSFDQTGFDMSAMPQIREVCEARMKEVPSHLLDAARGLIARLRVRARPTTADVAILMYEAKDLRYTGRNVDVEPGTWCAYMGKYQGKSDGSHMLRRDVTEYVAFQTSEDLTHMPDKIDLTIVGRYDSLREFIRVIGSRARCPYLVECLVFREN